MTMNLKRGLKTAEIGGVDLVIRYEDVAAVRHQILVIEKQSKETAKMHRKAMWLYNFSFCFFVAAVIAINILARMI